MYGRGAQSTPKPLKKPTYQDSYSNYPANSQAQRSRLQDSQKQKVIQDQNYSNNIMMTALSTLESLEIVSKNARPNRQTKLYGYYDKVNFDNKNYSELKSQLQTQLTILKASRQIFQEENSKSKYQLPSSFNEQRVQSELIKFQRVFENDKQVQGMCRDFEKISSGKYKDKMEFESKDYKVKYTKEEENKYKRDIQKNGMIASDYMDKQKEKVERLGITNQRDLPIYLNNQAYQTNSQYRQNLYRGRHGTRS